MSREGNREDGTLMPIAAGVEGKDGYLYLLRHVFGGELVDDAFVTQAEALLIRNVVDSLTPRESFVVVNRYLNKETLTTIASKLPNKKMSTESQEMFGVSRERVRQIEARALRKLRQPSRSQTILQIVERIFLPDENKNA